jgi:dephospho-CoA kinase
VFSSPKKRRALEAMIHPRVRARMDAALKKNKKPVAVCDIPLLFETGWGKRFSPVIVVTAPLRKRIARLKKKGFAVKDIKARLASQWPLEKKVKRADIVIRNSGSKNDVRRQVQKIYQSFVHKHVEDVNGIARK